MKCSVSDFSENCSGEDCEVGTSVYLSNLQIDLVGPETLIFEKK